MPLPTAAPDAPVATTRWITTSGGVLVVEMSDGYCSEPPIFTKDAGENMTPTRLAMWSVTLALALVVAGCSGTDDTTDSSADALTAAYLEGEWCSSEGLLFVFSEFGVAIGIDAESLAAAASTKTLLLSLDVRSVGSDEFVAFQLGREITFTRGGC